jgi:hypothetical protein
MTKRILTSHGAAARLSALHAILRARHPDEEVLVVGASQDAAAELVRNAGVTALFGAHRLTLGRLAALVAQQQLEERGLATLSPLGFEAVCARVVHQLAKRSALGALQRVAH